MKHAIFVFTFLFSAILVFGQTKQTKKVKAPPTYSSLAAEADSFYRIKDYKNASRTYSKAFKANNWKGTATERYNAASAWAMTNMPDSAFANLNSLSTEYADYSTIAADANFKSLRGDKRWQPLMETVRQNRDRATASRFNQSLSAELDGIYKQDQQDRMQISALEKQHGWQSKEVESYRMAARQRDSANLMRVQAILDQNGWLGSDVVGPQGNSTLFLIMQRADPAVQEKYLPMMREAVKNNRLSGSNLALIEDQWALSQGKRQIYGTQIARDPETQTYYILPLDDPDNVDKRRAELGLSPMSNYVNRWQITWDPIRYKQDLPSIEAKQKPKGNQ